MDPDKISILVVDDVNAMRAQITRILREAGFDNITTAPNGLEAINLVTSGKEFHIVISDLHMTPIGGMDLYQHMKGDAALKDVPFIMLTGENTKEVIMQVIQGGVKEFVLKPFKSEHVTNRVINLLVKAGVL